VEEAERRKLRYDAGRYSVILALIGSSSPTFHPN
jgi:hypothetical protein